MLIVQVTNLLDSFSTIFAMSYKYNETDQLMKIGLIHKECRAGFAPKSDCSVGIPYTPHQPVLSGQPPSEDIEGTNSFEAFSKVLELALNTATSFASHRNEEGEGCRGGATGRLLLLVLTCTGRKFVRNHACYTWLEWYFPCTWWLGLQLDWPLPQIKHRMYFKSGRWSERVFWC